eukprot:GHRR01032183.1.p1 GENE.GHRR01032183.1~~GHRR01032183.1.p1  ORF type:complete len:492 (+),score=132.74 GHRR01032183.1:329-1804(+)
MLLQAQPSGLLHNRSASPSTLQPVARSPLCTTAHARPSRDCRNAGIQQQLAALGLCCPCCSSSNSFSHHSHPHTRHIAVSTAVADAVAAEPARQEAAAVSDGDFDTDISTPVQQSPTATTSKDWSVLNFYHLVDITDPQEVLARHKAYITDNGLTSICGRIYISSQGINCQGGGLKTHAEQYAEWVKSQSEFQGLFYTIWPASGAMFPKLRLKVKPSLISLAGGMAAIPCTKPDIRATPLNPADWKQKLAEADSVNKAVAHGMLDASKRVVVMDLRNDYEWDAGHFDWAPRPQEEVFAETPVGVHTDGEVPAPLQGADPENTEIMMYCTGGIRCDVYSALLRQKGFKRLYSLHGGIQNYLREEGNKHWNGSLFVFDGRMAINPTLQQQCGEDTPLPAAVPCQLCSSEQAVLPHVNCANMDCNELFIACNSCKAKYHGCCCAECQNAPRLLRPIKLNGGNYGNWGNYADVDTMGSVISQGRTRKQHCLLFPS